MSTGNYVLQVLEAGWSEETCRIPPYVMNEVPVIPDNNELKRHGERVDRVRSDLTKKKAKK